jgi:predicted ribonuclease YlaK
LIAKVLSLHQTQGGSRGSLVEGIDLKVGLRVISRPLEPSFARLPAGLDPAIPDDRILGSALELQREHPASAVVLVTGDINLQTKAELGGLPFVELPTARRD